MKSIDVLRTQETWIQKSPDICGGDACIRNTRIPVWSLVAARRSGIADVDLFHHFITPLSAADVEAAFTYYDGHRKEIEREIQLNE
jgi:uncharacterized protein (DUF433 family)